MPVTPRDLYAFGSRSGPRGPRPLIDFFPDSSGMIGPEAPPNPQGASLFADPAGCPLQGHFHVLPTGTLLPVELEIVAYGVDVDPQSPHPASHHTLYPKSALPTVRFLDFFNRLPWKYAGKK